MSRKTFSTNDALFSLDELHFSDLYLLQCRIDGFNKISTGVICNHHRKKYLDYYSTYQDKCCDPLNRHKKSIKKDLRIISIEKSNIFYSFFKKKLIPGNKLRKTCENSINSNLSGSSSHVEVENETLHVEDNLDQNKINQSESQQSNISSKISYSNTDSSGSIYKTSSHELESLINLCEELNVPPLKKQKLSEDRLKKRAQKLILNLLPKLIQKVSKVYNTDVLLFENTVTTNIVQDSFALRVRK